MRFNDHTENEAFENPLKQRRTVDPAAVDTTMLYYPDWKPTKKQQWLNSKDYMCLGQTTYRET